jgi:hypothetical protein
MLLVYEAASFIFLVVLNPALQHAHSIDPTIEANNPIATNLFLT